MVPVTCLRVEVSSSERRCRMARSKFVFKGGIKDNEVLAIQEGVLTVILEGN